MDSPDRRPDYRVLSMRTILLSAVALLVLGVGVAVWLLLAYGDGTPQATNRLEAVQTAGTIVLGAAGAGVLWLVARRQWSNEIALRQKDLDQAQVDRSHALQEQVAAAHSADAAERRVTEMYASAADQLGSDKAAVRLAGMYALERLADSTPGQRRTITNVLCAYLRMPYPARDPAGNQEYEQERQVRLTAQRILAAHLRPAENRPSDTAFWPDLDLDLTGATLIDADFSGCVVGSLRLTGAVFAGRTVFTGMVVERAAAFDSARFTRAVVLDACFRGPTRFSGARFDDAAEFGHAIFLAEADFRRAQFGTEARFAHTRFAGDTRFDRARFAEDAVFSDLHFQAVTTFDGAEFHGCGRFTDVRFDGGTRFDNAKFTTFTEFTRVRFGGYVESSRAQFIGDTRFSHVRFVDSARFKTARFSGDAQFIDALVKLDVPDTVVRVWPRIEKARPGEFAAGPLRDQRMTPADEPGVWGELRYLADK